MGSNGPARWSGSGKRAVQARSQGASAGGAFAAPQTPDVPEATDAAKALAAEYDVDLETVTPTGSTGGITKGDVQAVIDAREPADEEPDDDEDQTDSA